MFDQPYSPSQLAEIGTECGHVPLTARGWNAFFAKHNIEGKQRSGRGGGKVYAIDVLPTHLRLQLSRMLPKLGHEITDRTQAKIAILHGFKQFLNVTHLKTSQGRAVFCDLYNARCFPPATLPTGVIKHLSPRSLFSWVKALEGDTSALRDDRRGRARPSVIDIANGGAVRDYVVGLIATSQFYTSGQIRDCLRAQFGKTLDVDGKRVPLPTDRAIRRFVARWRAANARDLMAVENPDAWKNKYQLAIGDQNAGITRPNQRWEIDASPVDALTVDGRYQLYCLIDIYTRRMRVLISKTPRTTAALELIRQCIMEWGVPEAIRTDNGSDFTSKHFKIAMDCLGIMHDVVPPFSPEKKGTVERAIGTLQRDIIRLLPGFVGHSVKDRKMIEGRKAFATRLGENADAAFCVNMRAEEIHDTLSAWCAGIYEKRPHSSLPARRSPHAIYASANFTPRMLDAEALHILLAPIDGNGLRTVTKKGIRIGAAKVGQSIDDVQSFE
ncbi:MAG: transposase family protein [Pseudomonadota bacterium]